MPVPVTTLIPDASVEAADAPEPLIEQKLRDAAIEFCRESFFWQETIRSRPAVAARIDYTLEAPVEGAQIISILAMRHNGELLVAKAPGELDRHWPDWSVMRGPQARVFVPRAPNRFTLVPQPTVSDGRGLTDIRIALAPTYTAAELPEVLVDGHREAIVSGALYRLLRMPGRAWTNGDLAAVHLQAFDEAVGLAKAETLSGWSPASATVRIARVPGMP
jgi:hypothetical protein